MTRRPTSRVLSEGFTGWNVLRTIVWDLRATVGFVRELIVRKRGNPGDDILTGLVQAEEAGQQLSDDELVSMASWHRYAALPVVLS